MTTNIDAKAEEIRQLARKHGLAIRAHDGIVTVTGSFTKGDAEAYREMESNAYDILRMFRRVRAGSTWGSDSGSVGGHIALESGKFVMNKSGVDKRLAARFSA